ncbi:cell division control protein 6 [Dorcoceras hygrometricum]|uniref:Cell division control protein 6 n=1 Tax=Dorcoceras hygrometricum TaxID=472368 RepID=A0A2Z7AUU4_9LAMI|nr:cell division control protein 6 [Dorcoceras hygrometricum]
MPAVANFCLTPPQDHLPENGRGATARKRRLRSDSDSVTPSRRKIAKSPGLSDGGCSNSPPEENVSSIDFHHVHSDVEQVRAVNDALHVSTAPKSVVCRENEQNMILDFCKKCVKQEKAGSMYISGSPGTGKSLSVETIKEILVNWANEERLQPPDILSMNCMFHAQTTEIFSKILRKHYPLRDPNFSKLPLQFLHSLYSQKQALDVKMILVVVDELDCLITKDRTALQDLFMLTTLRFSRCILLGIANAIDLADRFMPKLQSLNCKPVVITFRAYSKDQIIMILKDRLRALPYTVFQPQAVELCAVRVAAASGDMRKALAICSSAIGMLEAEIRDSTSYKSLPLTGKNEDQLKSADFNWLTSQANNLVRIDHVAAALSKTFKSPAVDSIQSLPQHQQIVLCSAVKLFRAGKKDTTVGELNKFYRDVCKSTSIPPVGIMELSSMCRVLDDQGIIKLGQSREDNKRRVALKVDSADIAFALQDIVLYLTDAKNQRNLKRNKIIQAKQLLFHDVHVPLSMTITSVFVLIMEQGVRFFSNCLQ